MNITGSDLAQAVDVAAKPLEVAIVLPTFNERANVATMVERLDAALKGVGWEAIFVDDNSPDGTSDEARRLSRHIVDDSSELGDPVFRKPPLDSQRPQSARFAAGDSQHDALPAFRCDGEL